MARKPKHLTMIYAIAVAALICSISALIILSQDTSEEFEWVCSQQVCAEFVAGGEAWAQENCGLINSTEGLTEACLLSIEGQPQYIPRESINLSAIQLCTEFRCVQEIAVRESNYTLPLIN